MALYFIGMYQPEGVVPGPEVLEPIMREMGAFAQELRDSGSLVFTNGFDQGAPVTVVTSDGTSIDVKPGSYLASEEQLGGFTVVDVDDEQRAHDVATRMAEITHLPIEVRRFAAPASS